jgi:hypothetical protein
MKVNNKEKIRHEYVYGYIAHNQRIMPTLDDLINKYKVASSSIYLASSKEKWKEQRNNFTKQLSENLDVLKMNEIQSKMGVKMITRRSKIKVVKKTKNQDKSIDKIDDVFEAGLFYLEDSEHTIIKKALHLYLTTKKYESDAEWNDILNLYGDLHRTNETELIDKEWL